MLSWHACVPEAIIVIFIVFAVPGAWSQLGVLSLLLRVSMKETLNPFSDLPKPVWIRVLDFFEHRMHATQRKS